MRNAWVWKVSLDSCYTECVVPWNLIVLVSSPVRILFLIRVLLLDSLPSWLILILRFKIFQKNSNDNLRWEINRYFARSRSMESCNFFILLNNVFDRASRINLDMNREKLVNWASSISVLEPGKHTSLYWHIREVLAIFYIQ